VASRKNFCKNARPGMSCASRSCSSFADLHAQRRQERRLLAGSLEDGVDELEFVVFPFVPVTPMTISFLLG